MSTYFRRTRSYLVTLSAMALIGLGGCGSVPSAMTQSGALDSDGDGFPDNVEKSNNPGTDPFDATDNPNNVRDTDGDGCSDFDELNFVGFCDGNPFTCPTVMDVGNGFSLTVPCGFVPVENSLVPIPGASFQRVYASFDLLIAAALFPSAQGSGALPDELGSFQFNGPVLTASGDFLLQEHYETPGFEGERVTGLLDDGQFLFVLVLGETFDTTVQTVAAGVFLSIDMFNTDGTVLFDLLSEFANLLQVRPSDGFLVLEDETVWYVGTDDDAVVAFWNDADLVLRGTPDSSIDDAMFTSMVSWESIDARLCGTGIQAAVAGINEREIMLESGVVLESSFADEGELLFWQVGDPVSVVTGASCSMWSTYVVNLRTGSTVGVP